MSDGDQRPVNAGGDPVERRLVEERPTPSPGFRSGLARGIEALARRLPGREAQRRWALVCLLGGLVLLGLAAISVAGWGPLSA